MPCVLLEPIFTWYRYVLILYLVVSLCIYIVNTVLHFRMNLWMNTDGESLAGMNQFSITTTLTVDVLRSFHI